MSVFLNPRFYFFAKPRVEKVSIKNYTTLLITEAIVHQNVRSFFLWLVGSESLVIIIKTKIVNNEILKFMSG